MEFAIAAAALAAVGIVFYGVRHRLKRSRPAPADFVCRQCGEKHCQCERQT
jgi:hypothetical protein